MKRFAAVGMSLFLLTLGARAADAQNSPVKVSFDLLKSQHIVVQVKVNGQGPYRLIFDTGAPVTLLNNKVARAAGVLPKGYRPSPFALFGAADRPFKIKTLQLGQVVARDLPVIVVDHPTVEYAARVAGPIEGIVGLSFFGRYRMTVDYQAKVLTFVPTAFEPPDLMQTIMKGLLGAQGQAKKEVLAPAGQWGLRVHTAKGDSGPGVIVEAVLPGGPAAAAGLKAGDRLLVLDGYWTDTVQDCYMAATHVRPGTRARITIRRDGKEQELTVQVREGL